MIQAKKHQGLLCIQTPPVYNGEVTRAVRGKWSKKWNCIVSDWTSFNCAKMIEISQRFSWMVNADIEDAGWPVILGSPQLFPHINRLPPYLAGEESLESKLEAIQGNHLKRSMWQHQKDAFRRLAMMNGVILDMGMGCGKSLAAISLIMAGKHDMGFIVCPKSVIDVWPLEFFRNSKKDFHILQRGKESIAKFVKNIEKERHNAQIYKRPFVFICNYEAVWRGELADFIKNNAFDYIVYDECVPGETEIATKEGGKKRIDHLKIGDSICGFDDITGKIVDSKVLHVFKRETTEPLTKVRELSLTSNHPVWTLEGGYVEAGKISSLDTVGIIDYRRNYENTYPNLRMVPAGIREPVFDRQKRKTSSFLYNKLFSKMENVATWLKYLGKNERGDKRVTQTEGKGASSFSGIQRENKGVSCLGEKSIQAGTGSQTDRREGAFDASSERLRAPYGWKRKRDADSTEALGCCSWLGTGVFSQLWERFKKKRIANALFNRCSESNLEDGHRIGRTLSHYCVSKSERCKERLISCLTGLDHPSVQERADTEQPRRMPAKDSECSKTVYNIETTTGNYFANGLLVHNCHRLKTASGSASKFAAAIRKNASRVIGGTGTLLPHSPLDAFAIYRAVDPGVFGTHYIPFRSRYAVLGGFEGKQVVDFQNQGELHEILKSISFRIKTEDAVELPPAQHIERFCELSPATRKVYESMKDDLIAEFEGHTLEAANAMVKVLRLMQCTSGVMKDTDGNEVRVGKEKAELFADIMEDIACTEPVVVFCNFTADLTAVKEIAISQGRSVAELSGKKNELKIWQDGGADVLVVQIKAGKEGVDFTRATICFYYSIGHSLGEYLQSERRIHRPGQTRPVVYYHLLAKNSIDINVYKALDKKHDIVLSVLDGLGLRTNKQGGGDEG